MEHNIEHELVPIHPHQEVAAHVAEAIHKVSPVTLTRAQLLLVVNRNRIYLDFEPNFNEKNSFELSFVCLANND